MADNLKADPRIQLEQARLAERQTLVRLKDKEKEMRILLAELQAMRTLKEEAIEQLEEQIAQDAQEEHEHLERDIDKLEDLVGEVETARTSNNNNQPYDQREERLYTPGGDVFSQATSSQTIEDMYAIMYKPAEEVTQEDREKFMRTSQSIMATMQYKGNLSDIVSSAVERTYNVVKNVIASQPSLVQNYVNGSDTKPLSEQFFNTVKKISEDYKPASKDITKDYK